MPKISPFEKYAEQYEEWFVVNRWVYEVELRAVKAMLPVGGHGVEIGVGSGRFAEPIGNQDWCRTFKTHERDCSKAWNSGHGWGS